MAKCACVIIDHTIFYIFVVKGQHDYLVIPHGLLLWFYAIEFYSNGAVSIKITT